MIGTGQLLAVFQARFGKRGPIFAARAPGRASLVGAHTDYNLGLVITAAVDREVIVLARRRKDRKVRLFSLNFGDSVEFSLNGIRRSRHPGWADYPRGVAMVLQESGVFLTGLDAVVGGGVPIEGGMGSSAALEVAFALAFLAAADFSLVPRDLARLCQRAENEFVGMHCGILDQFSSIFGAKGFCLLLDCRSLDSERIALPSGVRIVVANTMVKRALASSRYNRRRRECEEGVRRLRMYLPEIGSLRDVSRVDLRKHGRHLPLPIRKRCLHVVDEIARARRAARRLKAGDGKGFGKLMFASYRSCRDLYETSSPELDFLIREAGKIRGVLGAKITGAGFGGCTVNLIQESAVSEFRKRITSAYRASFGVTPDIFVCQTAPGASARCLRP